MTTKSEDAAWLETDGNRHVLRGNCSLGRSSSNNVVFSSEKISRRHAIIHFQNLGEFWLIDLGSINGTFVNKRRLHQPVRLSDRDQIGMGDTTLTFRLPFDLSVKYRTTMAKRTVQEIEDLPCWLLLADIKNFTPLCRSVVSERLAQLLGNWLSHCKEIVDRNFGTINKYLGDGFLAYWKEHETARANVANAIAELKKLQQQREPQFRFVVHYGAVAVGGIASLGEESLMGREVNLIFRLEKLAGALDQNCTASDTGCFRLEGMIAGRLLGEYELKGFEGKRPLFAI